MNGSLKVKVEGTRDRIYEVPDRVLFESDLRFDSCEDIVRKQYGHLPGDIEVVYLHGGWQPDMTCFVCSHPSFRLLSMGESVPVYGVGNKHESLV